MTRKIIQAAVATGLLMGCVLGALAQNPGKSEPDANHIIELAAKKYEFSPDEIRVKKGEKVRLKVHSTDEEHGIKLELYRFLLLS